MVITEICLPFDQASNGPTGDACITVLAKLAGRCRYDVLTYLEAVDYVASHRDYRTLPSQSQHNIANSTIFVQSSRYLRRRLLANADRFPWPVLVR